MISQSVSISVYLVFFYVLVFAGVCAEQNYSLFHFSLYFFDCGFSDVVRLCQSVCDAFHGASNGTLVCSFNHHSTLPRQKTQVSWITGPWSKVRDAAWSFVSVKN